MGYLPTTAGAKASNVLRETVWRTGSEAAAERERLIRFCHKMTGSRDAADDLAQETMVEAWRRIEKVRDRAAWRSFVYGVARNLCLRHLRREGISRERTQSLPDFDAPDALAAPDFIEELERREVLSLLDATLSALPAPARALLVERHVDETPFGEMAARRGMTENALRVRTHRARAALTKTLTMPAYREMAAAHGLIATDRTDGWQETQMWCPRCGNHKLEARVGDPARPDNTWRAPYFAVRCRECRRNLGMDFTSGHPYLPANKILAPVRGYRPLVNRLVGWRRGHFAEGMTGNNAPCPRCGLPLRFAPTPRPGTFEHFVRMRGLYFYCGRCPGSTCLSASGLAYHHPAAQQFWRDHPRMALTPERDIQIAGQPAVLVRFVSRTDNAAFEIAFSRKDFQPLSVSR